MSRSSRSSRLKPLVAWALGAAAVVVAAGDGFGGSGAGGCSASTPSRSEASMRATTGVRFAVAALVGGAAGEAGVAGFGEDAGAGRGSPHSSQFFAPRLFSVSQTGQIFMGMAFRSGVRVLVTLGVAFYF